MTLREKQQQLIEELSLIEDRMERFSIVVDRARKYPGLRDEEKIDDHRVPGCVSTVWLIPSLENGRCRFRVDAESSIVRGVAVLLCQLYSDCPPDEVAEVEPELLDELGIAAQLTPTRRNGLQHIRRQIREFAEVNS